MVRDNEFYKDVINFVYNAISFNGLNLKTYSSNNILDNKNFNEY